jgi:hypothetical protein
LGSHHAQHEEHNVKYTQHNPVPLPAGAVSHAVQTTMDSVFDWQYALEKQNLMALYEKGKAATWNTSDLDWDAFVDPQESAARRRAEGAPDIFNTVLQPPRQLNPEELTRFNVNLNGFMLSQFLHGEQGALVATAKIVQQVPWEEAKFYAANQVADEARHVEAYHRYLTEKLGVSYAVHPSLGALLDDIVGDSRWDITYLGMQIMVEGLALAAFGMMRFMMPEEPLILDITQRIMADESRHVAFGVLSLGDLYRNEMSENELREREEFVIEATHLMRERLLMTPVFERLGFDLDVWVPWMEQTPFMRGFRQMLFSKIVPNLKRLGLLTPRVREAYAKLDLLRFEGLKDSIEEPGVEAPQEMVELLMQSLNGGQPAAGAPAR